MAFTVKIIRQFDEELYQTDKHVRIVKSGSPEFDVSERVFYGDSYINRPSCSIYAFVVSEDFHIPIRGGASAYIVNDLGKTVSSCTYVGSNCEGTELVSHKYE